MRKDAKAKGTHTGFLLAGAFGFALFAACGNSSFSGGKAQPSASQKEIVDKKDVVKAVAKVDSGDSGANTPEVVPSATPEPEAVRAVAPSTTLVVVEVSKETSTPSPTPAPSPEPESVATPMPTPVPSPVAVVTPFPTTPPGKLPPAQDLPLTIKRLTDTASNRNCIVVSVNGGPDVDFGCNRLASYEPDPKLEKEIVVKALPKPYCNVVRVKLTTQPKGESAPSLVRTSENRSQVKNLNYWVFSTLADFRFQLSLNDNDDDNPRDANMILDANGKLFFTVENSGLGCTP